LNFVFIDDEVVPGKKQLTRSFTIYVELKPLFGNVSLPIKNAYVRLILKSGKKEKPKPNIQQSCSISCQVWFSSPILSPSRGISKSKF